MMKAIVVVLALLGAPCISPAVAQPVPTMKTEAGGPSYNEGQAMLVGRAPTSLWNPHGLIIPKGPLSVRNVPDGCEDNGTVASFVAAAITSNSGINGGCDAPLAMMAGYGSFDVAAVFEGIDLADPRLTVGGPAPDGRPNVSYDATHAYFGTPLSPEQVLALRPGQYVVTNAGGDKKTGSILTGWSSDGSGITVAGWIVLGSHNSTPAAPAPPRSPALPTVYLGAPTNQFGRNTVCGIENSPTIDNWTCWEMDVVNNTNSRKRVGGITVLGIGTGGFDGDGVSVGSTAGYAGAFHTGVSVANFQVSGLAVTQTPGAGGVGVYVGMNAGLPIAVQNSATGVDVMTVDSHGTLNRDNPVGKTVVSQVVVSGSLGDELTPIPLTSDGSKGFESGGAAAVHGSLMRMEADILGLGRGGSAVAWHVMQLATVSQAGDVMFIGKPRLEQQGGVGPLLQCAAPHFIAKNGMIFPVAEPCSAAGALAPVYGGDVRLLVQSR